MSVFAALRISKPSSISIIQIEVVLGNGIPMHLEIKTINLQSLYYKIQLNVTLVFNLYPVTKSLPLEPPPVSRGLNSLEAPFRH